MRRSQARPLAVVAALGAASVLGLAGCAPEPEPSVSVSGTISASPSASVASASPSASQSASPVASQSPSVSAPTTEPSESTPQDRTRVSVVIVTWGVDGDALYASAVIPELRESGGTCTLHANGPAELTASRDAEETTESVNCGITRIDATAGEWELTMEYSSSAAEGLSDGVTVTVP